MTLNLSDLPEITFTETNIDGILNRMIRDYEEAHREATGTRLRLRPGDPRRIFLYAQALRELQLRVNINDAARQNLLAFARGDILDHLGAFSRTSRNEPEPARATMKYTLSSARATDETIEAGTRSSPGGEIYFAPESDVLIPAGDTSVEFTAICTESGTMGNGFTPGQISIQTDPIPFVSSVENLTESFGGINRENDDSYRQRIHLGPIGFSVAGPELAYENLVRNFSSAISDVKIDSPNPSEVDIYILIENGSIPDTELLDDLQDYLAAKDRRPLTDLVNVSAPDIVNYNLELTYYISEGDAEREDEVIDAVEDAISEYVIWQRSRVGRDINPSELISQIVRAGAKRVEVASPAFTQVGEFELAVVDEEDVTYGGLEDE